MEHLSDIRNRIVAALQEKGRALANEIILHIHDDQYRLLWIKSEGNLCFSHYVSSYRPYVDGCPNTYYEWTKNFIGS